MEKCNNGNKKLIEQLQRVNERDKERINELEQNKLPNLNEIKCKINEAQRPIRL